ncbi:uncharacterized protein EV154DRAFT_538691 [Mucor mucedo]|uniref:uncharacterized protein n=1 Tax=Mucor mucedo TaxID=29922 RepID=UPI00221EB043|nr:uncharacterized protein EV154DRAFT_538691 [Mucor mucedo]KAI7889903.1 hypothetical protein EV154DRAFT_538691 [Mucor mucedo]
MFHDGICQQINEVNGDVGWHTMESDDWMYYPQQTVNVSLTAATISAALVGGCCAPNRYKTSGFLFQDDGSTYSETGNKIVAISDLPLMQNITVTGWYMKKFVDDHAMNLTVIPSVHHPDKQSIFFEIAAFDRGMIIKYIFYDYEDKMIGNHSTGLLRNVITVPDITVPRFTRRVFLCRTPSHKVLMCIIVMLGSFILNQAWNILNSQSSIFHEWLPRAAKIVAITTCTLFGLRMALDIPSYAITFARNLPFLVINLLAAVPTIVAYSVVLLYFSRNHDSWFATVWTLLTVTIWQIKLSSVTDMAKHPGVFKKYFRKLFGLHQYVRIPFAIKTSLSLLVYCLGQLIPLLLTQMIGVGGVVPRHICSWSPYLSQFQYHPQPMEFAISAFFYMQVSVFVATGFTGTLYFMVEISLIGTFVTMLILMDRFRESLIHHLGYGVFFASFFIAFIVQLLQKCITNLIFVESRTRFSIQHRSPFLHYWYFMMLTSMTRALTSYIIRTLKLVVRYPLFSLRVDRNAETWSVRRGDGGFTAYCGMLLAEHEYNNPVVLAFIECILHSTQSLNSMPDVKTSQNTFCSHHKKKLIMDLEKRISPEEASRDMKGSDATLIADTKTKPCQTTSSAKRAKARWFLAYTLSNNPGVSFLFLKKKQN